MSWWAFSLKNYSIVISWLLFSTLTNCNAKFGYVTPKEVLTGGTRATNLKQYDQSLYELRETGAACTGHASGPLFIYNMESSLMFLWDSWLWNAVGIWFLCHLLDLFSSVCLVQCHFCYIISCHITPKRFLKFIYIPVTHSLIYNIENI